MARRFPQHIVELVQGVLEKDSGLILADALEELGLIECSKHFRDPNHSGHFSIGQNGCRIRTWILNNNCDPLKQNWDNEIWFTMKSEIDTYLGNHE